MGQPRRDGAAGPLSALRARAVVEGAVKEGRWAWAPEV